nr:ferric reductase-like transmembrane domain-containing protein [Jannaschia sp. Os4]
MALLLVQAVAALGWLPGATGAAGRRLHAWTGMALLALVALHVGGLWVTSPPDVIDALLLRSPTPFSVWGVLALAAVLVAALVAAGRRRLPPRAWRAAHRLLVTVAAGGTVAHALLIQGTMGVATKWMLCALVAVAALAVAAGIGRRAPAFRAAWRAQKDSNPQPAD